MAHGAIEGRFRGATDRHDLARAGFSTAAAELRDQTRTEVRASAA